ncbi:(deoxy)nucleoside triphosphate pyrophosphohydrolase [Acidaminobacter hydrogenoformans]|uniref:(deoxy)nucleoside triphosphate pyrophosphohydrolase n=1 Tax=Acidaminobacter hydrogenoformans TaxID=65403 RepID=UPI001A9A69C1|nr:(deoxy)nucleoside triphosphate pyrophosphohydrolase [Acidaminobacter hydrogenoformans]
MKRIEVTAAIIRRENKLLICQRDSKDELPDLWEFPGGKLEPGETLEDCIRREIEEELCLKIEPLSVFGTTGYSYKDKLLHFTFYNAVILGGEMTLEVHRDARWIDLKDLGNYEFMPADVPVVRQLMGLLRAVAGVDGDDDDGDGDGGSWPEMPFEFENVSIEVGE